MYIQCDTLKYATILKNKGVTACDADALMSTLTEIEIFNIHNKIEVNGMLSESIEKIFAKQDEKLAEQRREFDARMKEIRQHHDAQLRETRSELLASRRWMIGSVITVGLSLDAYLSALTLIHFNH